MECLGRILRRMKDTLRKERLEKGDGEAQWMNDEESGSWLLAAVGVVALIVFVGSAIGFFIAVFT